MPTGLLHALEAEAAKLRDEGNALAVLAEREGGYGDSGDRMDAITGRLAAIDSDLARERYRQSWERSALAVSILDAVGPAPDGKPPTPFKSLGEQLVAVHRTVTNPGRAPDPRLVAINEWYSVQAAATGAGEAVGADGGFLVQTDIADMLAQRVFNSGVLAGRCRQIEIGAGFNSVVIPLVNETSRADGSRFGAVRHYWLDEGATITASRPKFAQERFNLVRMAGLLYLTDDLLADVTALTSIADSAFEAEMAFGLDDAIFNGTGSGRPRGILNENATVSVSKETGQLAATVVGENVKKMYARLWAGSVRNAVWYMNQDVWPQVFELHQVIGTGGVPLFVPPGTGLSQSPWGTLLGRPIEVIEHAATLGTVGDFVLADLSQYILVRKGDIARASSIHVNFTADETAFRWVMRVNGGSSWVSALTPYKGTGNTQSPFITLATRS